MSIQIQSIGPPPEKHADRVVAEMMRHLTAQRAGLWDTIQHLVVNSNDGAPAGQRKLTAKIEQAGVRRAKLHPGKRGKYQIDIYDMTGFDPECYGEIRKGDPCPEKPWLAQWVTLLQSSGNGRGRIALKSRLLVLITHHALSRAAQRFDVRTLPQMLEIANAIGIAAVKLINEKRNGWLDAPPRGWPISIAQPPAKATVILKRHENGKVLVAATVYGDN